MKTALAARPRLIVNADDFGRAPGVSRGIVAAHRRGIVTSTTLMTNLPWAADAVALTADAPRLAIGLHLSLCYGPPVCENVPSLVGDDGRLNRDLAVLAARATAEDIEREARAQLARFVDLTGRLPTHLDSHLHVHAWPVCHAPIIALAREHDLPVRAADPHLARVLQGSGVATTDAFINAFFAPGQMTLERLLTVIEELRPGITELMVHPGYDDPALADSSFRTQRECELTMLTMPEVRAAIERRGIELVTWDEVRTRAMGGEG